MQALQQQQNSVLTDQATEVTISQDDVPEVKWHFIFCLCSQILFELFARSWEELRQPNISGRLHNLLYAAEQCI